jgi:excinuclease ABC subunit A
MAHFSFNKPAGACPTCTGLGTVSQANVNVVINTKKSITGGGVLVWQNEQIRHYSWVLDNASRYYGLALDLTAPIDTLGPAEQDLLLYGVRGPQFRRHRPDIEPPTTIAQGNFEGIITNLLRRYEEHIDNPDYRAEIEKLLVKQRCPDCNGERLRPESRQVSVAGQTIITASQLPLSDLTTWLDHLSQRLTPDEAAIAAPVLADLRERTRRLTDVGVGYLTLERSAPTLSAGEAQRLRLAALLGSGLTGVLYVLDEPTIGLHPRDMQRLIKVLRQLRDLGNTVLVIEHDLEMVRAADHVIDMGPGAGEYGGRIVAAGPPETLEECPESLTGKHLSGAASIPIPEQRRPGNHKRLVIRGAREHNLRNITVALPLGCLVAVTGASGSGKSSLMLDILDRAARQRFFNAGELPGEHDTIEGWEHMDKIVTIDQTAIGRTPRSNAATYSSAFTPLRQAFASTRDARERDLTARHFSFNVPGGRCERCKGAGMLTVKMHFLPEALVRCPNCRGRRFKQNVLDVHYSGHNIADVLEMTIEEALPLFQQVPAAAARLSLMIDVGLGYLRLGQPATTLSGGEAQRIKLAKELGRRATGRTLYLLDEPTTGLHAADVAYLLAVLQRLVDAGNTVVLIEHNLDVIKAVDWIIDLGPEGGNTGGQIVAEGTPERVAKTHTSRTGQYLVMP